MEWMDHHDTSLGPSAWGLGQDLLALPLAPLWLRFIIIIIIIIRKEKESV